MNLLNDNNLKEETIGYLQRSMKVIENTSLNQRDYKHYDRVFTKDNYDSVLVDIGR